MSFITLLVPDLISRLTVDLFFFNSEAICATVIFLSFSKNPNLIAVFITSNSFDVRSNSSVVRSVLHEVLRENTFPKLSEFDILQILHSLINQIGPNSLNTRILLLKALNILKLHRETLRYY